MDWGTSAPRTTRPSRQAVSSSSDPHSSSWATCSASVCSSTSIWVTRKSGCSLPITRSRPRSPACSRLIVVVRAELSGLAWSRRTDEEAPPPIPPAHARSEPHDAPAHGPAADFAHPGRRRVRHRGSPHHRRTGTQVTTNPFQIGRGIDLPRPVQVGAFARLGISARRSTWWPAGPRPRRCRSAAMIQPRFWTSRGRPRAASRCCQSRVSSRSLSTRSRSPVSEVPVPMRSPRTVSRTVPCSSSTSRSASPPVGSGCGHSRVAVAGVAGRTVGT